jgi:hypothetical protein
MLTLVVFIAVPISYAFFMAKPGQRLRRFLLVAAAGVLALMLCAAYLLPMQWNKSLIHAEMFIKGRYDYSQHFWMLHSLFGFLCFVPPLAGLYFEQPKADGKRRLTKALIYWIAIICVLLFFILPCSKFVWDAVIQLQYLQFPMRFYMGMWPGAVFLATAWLPQAKTRIIYPFLLVMMLGNVSLNSWQTWFNDHAPPAGAKTLVGLYFDEHWMPRWVDPEHVPALPQAAAVEGRGTAKIEEWQPGHIRLHADIQGKEALVALHQFYFPYWQASAGTPEPFHGLLALRLPSGSRDIDVRFAESDIAGEPLGRGISLSTLILLAICGWLGRKRKPNPASAAPAR